MLAGASAGIADMTQTETAKPIPANTWMYLGNQKRVRAQNLNEAPAAKIRRTP